MKSFSPAAERNRDAILDVLRAHLPELGTILEVGSGTGQHIAHFAQHLPKLNWQPSDHTPDRFSSIQAWVAETAAANVALPCLLDAAQPWPIRDVDAVYCANVIHISPWSVAKGLFAGASRCLKSGQRLIIYGPFKFGGHWMAQSNRAFDERLRGQDPSWGVRDVDDLRVLANQHALAEHAVVACPANNHCLVYEKVSDII